MEGAKITTIFGEAARAAIPLSTLTLSEWADTYRYLSPERAARPGKWHTDVVPHLRVPMDLVTRPDVRELYFVKSSQVAGTDGVANNAVGYYIHIDPSPIIYVAEDEGKAKAWSTEYFAPMVRDTPVLTALVSESKSRDSGNTIGAKRFPGGHLAVGWATSPATGSSRPRRVVVLDERDAFRPTGEGDYKTIIEARMKTFEETYKLLVISSPRKRQPPPPGSPPDAPHLSPIEREFANADYRGTCYLPCPHCDEYQQLTWLNADGDYNLKLDEDDPTKAYYVCVNGCVIEQDEKAGMLAQCEWRFEDKAGRVFTEHEIERLHMPVVGVKIWEAYSPFVSWGKLVNNFLKKKDNVLELEAFVNTSLGEGWDSVREKAEVGDLTERREPYELVVPLGVVLLTFGADVQDNRIEVEIVGWALDDESWSIDYKVFEGDPSLPDVWLKLEKYLAQPFPCEWGGVMRVAAGAIDTGGHHTDATYRFCHRHRGRRYYAIKGANTPGKPLAPLKPTLQGRLKVPLRLIGTEGAKDALANHLATSEPGPGYCHFPTERVDPETGRVYYGEDYFKQLRSERPVQRGAARVWVKLQSKARNEALDVRVYAMAAKAILKPDMEILSARIARQIAEAEAAPPIRDEEPPEQEAVVEAEAEDDERPRRYAPRRARGGYVERYREW